MSQPRPALKLKFTNSAHIAQPSSSQSTPVSASGTPKLKLKFGSSSTKPADPAVPPPASSAPAVDPKQLKSALKKVKKDRPPRLSAGKKRDHTTAAADGEIDVLPHNAAAPLTGSSIKKLKLVTKTPTTPFIRLKPKGRPPNRPLGVGYDSEASDREEDPAIEEEFILRMSPGEDCEYLRKAIEEKKWGPRSQEGADVRLKFLQNDGRRAVIIIRSRIYAATMVDLPCVIEGMKSWDKRGWWKTADICQMLLVLGPIKTENDAYDYPLPGKELDKTTWQYAHGITPPMRWVRKRRFRKRVSNRTIEAVEEEVERLLRLDEGSVTECKYDTLDLDRLHRDSRGQSRLGESGDQVRYGDGEQDAIGDADDGGGYFDHLPEDVDDDGLAADLERAMMESDAEDALSAATPAENTTMMVDTAQHTDSEATTPAAVTPAAETPGKDDSEDDESDEDDEAEEEVDEEVLERQADLQRQREEIADLEAAIRSQTAEYERQQNIILKKKLMGKIQSLKADLELKLAAIGEGQDD